jgi:hypothetical protein
VGGGKKRQQASPRCGFWVPSTPREPERSEQERGGARRKEEGGRKLGGGKKRQQASPRCGFPGTLHAQGARAERAQERGGARGRKKEEGRRGGEEEAAGFA